MHGDRKPPERKANLEKFKQQRVKFLICTDVAARGIDITGLPFSKSIVVESVNLIQHEDVRMGKDLGPFSSCECWVSSVYEFLGGRVP